MKEYALLSLSPDPALRSLVSQFSTKASPPTRHHEHPYSGWLQKKQETKIVGNNRNCNLRRQGPLYTVELGYIESEGVRYIANSIYKIKILYKKCSRGLYSCSMYTIIRFVRVRYIRVRLAFPLARGGVRVATTHTRAQRGRQ